jgi:hypothetical protein
MNKYSMQDIQSWIEEAITYNRGFSTQTDYATACANIAVAMMLFNERIEKEDNQHTKNYPYQ